MVTATLESLVQALDSETLPEISMEINGGRSERYSVPYPNDVPTDVHEKVRRRIERYLIKSDLIPEEAIIGAREKHREVITPDKWEMMKDTPEHYWALVFAYSLGKTHEKEFSSLRSKIVSNPDKKQRDEEFKRYYLRNQMAWLCVGLKLYREKNKVECASADAELEIAMSNSPIYRAFYTIWKGALSQNICYDSVWADGLIAEESSRTRRRDQIESDRIRAENAKRESVIAHPDDVSMIMPAQTVLVVPVPLQIIVPAA